MVYVGEEVLELPVTTIVEVVLNENFPDSTVNDNVGDLLFITSDDQHPFVNIKTGELWGYNISAYHFKLSRKSKI